MKWNLLKSSCFHYTLIGGVKDKVRLCCFENIDTSRNNNSNQLQLINMNFFRKIYLVKSNFINPSSADISHNTFKALSAEYLSYFIEIIIKRILWRRVFFFSCYEIFRTLTNCITSAIQAKINRIYCLNTF